MQGDSEDIVLSPVAYQEGEMQLKQEPLKPLKGMFVFKKLSEIGVTLCLCSGCGIDILWQFRHLMADSMLIAKYTRIRRDGKYRAFRNVLRDYKHL